MAANTILTVTGLSFDQIRSNLRNYMASRSTFKDLDFADSAIGSLLDLLAYNSYMLSFYVNMSTNEGFLDTAQLYDSVISRAKAIGYVPISARGPSANVRITFSATANSSVRSLQIAKNTQFTTSVNGASYIYVTPQSYTIPASNTNGFTGYITLTEGIPLTHRWTYSAANTYLTIPNANTDLSSIAVTVTTSGNTVTWIKANDIFTVGGTTPAFFVDADRGNRYRVSFGDGYLGAKPVSGSTVAVSYRVCSAAKTNGANTFTASGAVAGQTSFSLFTVERASGGSEQEPIESVRFNAPRAYETQNRAVTAEDYRRILLRENPDLQGVNVWGGEENIPPIYGKVYIAVKPNSGTTIGTTRKEQLRGLLRRFNVQSIDTEFVDAGFLYLTPDVVVNYNPTIATGSGSDLAAICSTAIANYESTYLNRFDGKFRASKFLEAVDRSDRAIVGSALFLKLSKRFTPSVTVAATYTFMFNHAFTHPKDGYLYVLTSSAFTYANTTCYLDDDGYGAVRIYYPNADGTRTYVNTSAGSVNYTTGQVDLIDFAPTAIVGTEMTITGEPASADYNVSPVRNQILLLRDATVSLVNDTTGLREVNKWAITTLGTSATVLAPSYSGTVLY
jgi:hypothetical protein